MEIHELRNCCINNNNNNNNKISTTKTKQREKAWLKRKLRQMKIRYTNLTELSQIISKWWKADYWKTVCTTDIASCWASWRSLCSMPPRTAASNPSGPHHTRASSCQTHRHLTLNEFFIVALIQRFPSCERIPKYAWDKIGFLSKREKNSQQREIFCWLFSSDMTTALCTPKRETISVSP